jgi:hypothetical protein
MGLRYLFILLVLCLPGLSQGQSNRIIDRNAIGWYTYNGDHKLAKRWTLHTEHQWRRVELIRLWQQSLSRLGANYKLSDRVKLGGGYTLLITYPYGDYPTADQGVPTFEHRSHQDIQLNDQLGIVKLSHRIRLEQRWLSIGADDNPRRIVDWEYQNRIRYQISGSIPLAGPTTEPGEFYANFFDELFIGFGRNVEDNIFNQNRISGGIGYQFLSNLQLELNYLNQITQHPESDIVSAKPVFEMNHGFRLNINYDLDFTKR